MQDRSPLAHTVTDDVAQAAAGRQNPLSTSEVTGAQLGSRYIDFLIPGLIGLNLMGSSLWSIGYNLVVQRKAPPLAALCGDAHEQEPPALFVHDQPAPVSDREVVCLVLFGLVLFGTKAQGSYLDLLLLSVLGGGSFAGISLLIGARLENAEVASGWMNVVQLPMWVVSGCFFPTSASPNGRTPSSRRCR